MRDMIIGASPAIMWRNWAWELDIAGQTTHRLDPVEARLHLEGEIYGVPAAISFALHDSAGYMAVSCPLCDRRLANSGLLVARVEASVRFGCTRCYPPPTDAPNPVEMRKALEALVTRRGVSASS